MRYEEHDVENWKEEKKKAESSRNERMREMETERKDSE